VHDFDDYIKRLQTRKVKTYLPPRFLMDNQSINFSETESAHLNFSQIIRSLNTLHPKTWFVHGPAGSGKTSLSWHIMFELLEMKEPVACVRITLPNLKRHKLDQSVNEYIYSLCPPDVDDRLWKSRSKKKRSAIILIIDGINETQSVINSEDPQWLFLLELLCGNHRFPVLATSRYLIDELDDQEREINYLSILPLSIENIKDYISAYSLNMDSALSEIRASGMDGVASNPFMLSLITNYLKQLNIVGSLKSTFPKTRAALLHSTITGDLSTECKDIGINAETVLSGAALVTYSLEKQRVSLKELVAIFQQVWCENSDQLFIDQAIEYFKNHHFIYYSPEDGYQFIHGSLVESGLAMALLNSDPNKMPVFPFINDELDTFIGDWVGLHPEPQKAAILVSSQAKRLNVPYKLIDVIVANRGILIDTVLHELWLTVGQGLISAQSVKQRTADALSLLPQNILRDGLRYGVFSILKRDNIWIARQSIKSLYNGHFSGRVFTTLQRRYNRQYRAGRAARLITKYDITSKNRNKYDNSELLKVIENVACSSSERLTAVDNLAKNARPGTVPSLLTILRVDNDKKVRGAILKALGRISDRKAVPDLIYIIQNEKNEILRGASISALGEIGDKRAIKPLLDRLENDDDSINRAAAAKALGVIGTRTVLPHLEKVFLNKEAATCERASAVYAIGQISDRQALPSLSQVILDSSEEPDVRGSAIATLGQIGDKEVVPIILETLRDTNNPNNIRRSSALALGKIGDYSAVETLCEIAVGNGDHDIRGTSAKALGQIGASSAVNCLIQVLEEEDAPHDVRGTAANALGQIGDRNAIISLSKILRDHQSPNDVRGSAANALGKLIDETAVPALIFALQDDRIDTYTKGAAAKALGELKDRTAVKTLLDIVENENMPVELQSSAVDALGKIGDPISIDLLIKNLLDDDKHSKIRGSSAKALGSFQDKRCVNALVHLLLGDANSVVRGTAVNSLGKMSCKESASVFVNILKNNQEDSTLRMVTAMTLGAISTKSINQTLIQLTEDSKCPIKVKKACVNAMNRIADISFASPLSKLLLNKSLPFKLRKAAIFAIGNINCEESSQALKDLYLSPIRNDVIRFFIVKPLTRLLGSVEPEIYKYCTEKHNGKRPHKGLRGKVVSLVARGKPNQDACNWLKSIVWTDTDHGCRTEAIIGLHKAHQLDDNLVRFLIDPAFKRRDNRVRDTDYGVLGQTAGAVIEEVALGFKDAKMLQIVIDLLAEPETHSDVIRAALTHIHNLPTEKSKQILQQIHDKIDFNVNTNEFFTRRINRLQAQIQVKIVAEQERTQIIQNPQDLLSKFKEKAIPKMNKQIERKMGEKIPLAKVVLVTVTDIESQTVLGYLKEQGCEIDSDQWNDRYFNFFELITANTKINVMQIQPVDKGALSTQSLILNIIRDIKPEVIIMVGVCMGFNERGAQEGDVVIARQVFGYERARKREGKYHMQPQGYRCSSRLLGLAKHLYNKGEFTEILNGRSLFTTKDYASGEKVLDDEEDDLRKIILDFSDDIIGKEMEGIGLLSAQWESCKGANIDIALIKAISDFGDGKMRTNKTERQKAAALRATKIVFEMLKNY